MFITKIRYFSLFLLLLFQPGCWAPANNHFSILINRSQLKELLFKNQGKHLILNYWASWCKNCKLELKILAELKKKFKTKGLEVIFVAVDNKDDLNKRALVNKIYQYAGLSEHIYISAESDPSNIMSVVAIKASAFVPVTYLLAPNGQLVRSYTGRYAMQYLTMTLNRKLN